MTELFIELGAEIRIGGNNYHCNDLCGNSKGCVMAVKMCHKSQFYKLARECTRR